MKKNRVMIVGAIGSGKTTLVRALNQEEDLVTKTQSVEYKANSIDTPGEFMENPFYYKALFSTSLEADIVLFIQDSTKKRSVFPPGFAGAFSKRTIGVVTKIDHPEGDMVLATGFLKSLGLSAPVIAVSAIKGDGMNDLRTLLQWD